MKILQETQHTFCGMPSVHASKIGTEDGEVSLFSSFSHTLPCKYREMDTCPSV